MQTPGCWEQGCKICIEVQIWVVVAAADSSEDCSRAPTLATPAEKAGHSLSCSRTTEKARNDSQQRSHLNLQAMAPINMEKLFVSVAKREENHQNIKN